jgi:hypothetical protein
MPLDFETASRRCEPSERRLVEQQESAKQPYGQLANARVNSIAISNLVLVYGMFSCVFAAEISHDVKIKTHRHLTMRQANTQMQFA